MSRFILISKPIFCLLFSISILLVIYTLWSSKDGTVQYGVIQQPMNRFGSISNHNIWLIFTRVDISSPLRYKFSSIIRNLLNVSSVALHFHIIVDVDSHKLALDELRFNQKTNKQMTFTFYNITEIVLFMKDIVDIMKPHFSSNPGTYYSDALFYISLGLYRFAPTDQDYAVLLDCDLYFKEDSALLFQEFLRFKPTALFGLAPELSPVYRHVLHRYRGQHKTTFGEFYNGTKNITQAHPMGFQGYNSGVVLLNLKAIKKSNLYSLLLTNSSVTNLTKKYSFRGHLGDQDFYTLVGYEYPQLIQTIHCGFNRQLCSWWRDHGYGDIFQNYSKCEHEIMILHGNCNTRIPLD